MKIPFLMYHSVLGSEDDLSIPPGYWIPSTLFEEHLVYLRETEFTTLSLRDFWKGRKGRTLLPPKSVILTFDDGYLNNYVQVLPRLLRFGFKASFFVTVSTIGRAGMMGLNELERLREAGMEIGSHGMNHELLAGKSRAELLRELRDSRRFLSGSLAIDINFFSLPRGYLPPELPRLVREVGYLGMCTSQPGYNSWEDDPFLWRRFPVRTGFSVGRLAAVLRKKGWNLATLYLSERLRSAARYRYRSKIFFRKETLSIDDSAGDSASS